MKLSSLLVELDLEQKHISRVPAELPIVESGLYNTLGRQLYDFYQKYKVEKADQRKIEALCFLLQGFTMRQDLQKEFDSPSKSTKKRWWF